VVSVAPGATARRTGTRTGQATAGLVLGVVAIVNMVIEYDVLT
jgi:hypothetical protein